MAFTQFFHIPLPAYKTVRYDLELNNGINIIEAALLGFPGEDPPGSATNYPDVTLTNGLRWLDTTNHQLKIYYAGTWQVIITLTP